jgi:DNA-binding response OmpR family regulator
MSASQIDFPEAVDPSRSVKCILVVEDNAEVRSIYRQIFVQDGFVVTMVADGRAAWAALQANVYDLLITDHNMPNMSGLELLQKIQEAKLTVPTIMATATAPADLTQLNLAALLLKPFTVADLEAAVNKILSPPPAVAA